MQRTRYFYLFMLVAVGFACKDAYKPDVIAKAPAYLVVEGVLTVNGPASVHLTRTSKIDSFRINPELGAQVTVEGKDNTTRTMPSSGNGIYSSPNLNLILGNEYRLRIRTSNGKEYLSEYVFARQTPAIDTIGRNQTDNELHFYVNSHDPSGNTRYYRWEYDETWEIKAYYFSQFIYVSNSNTVRNRTSAEDVSKGWKYNSSTSILLGSSARLQSDVISQAPITYIPKNDERTSVRYSLLVRQYALDKAGYDFYDLMKRNTESLGGIFDVQPSEITGNIKSLSDPSETVIGYVSASSISEKRIFVESTELPFSWRYIEYCPYYIVANNPDSFKAYFRTGTYSPYDAVYSPATGLITGYLGAFPACVDVTQRAASLIKPPYW